MALKTSFGVQSSFKKMNKICRPVFEKKWLIDQTNIIFDYRKIPIRDKYFCKFMDYSIVRNLQQGIYCSNYLAF